MKNLNILISLVLIAFLLGLTNCKKEPMLAPGEQVPIPSDKLTSLPSSDQRAGDADRGRDYLLYGDFVDSGIPLDVFLTVYGNPLNDLDRTGINEGVDHAFNAFTSSNGVDVAAPNCFQCHASQLNGNLLIGLGNTSADFTADQTLANNLLDNLIISNYGMNSPEWEAYEPFSKAVKASATRLRTETVGVNPADKLAAILAAHRDPISLEWIDEDQLDVPEEVVPTDVPAWWNLKKKNTMFYTSVGRGDFARISMASSLLTIKDTIKAREVDQKFADVIAYINSLEAPPYPTSVNMQLAKEGELLFNNNCSSCHGVYGDNESYPNLLVDLDLIQTDSMLIYANFGFDKFVDWYNDSWFGQGPFAAKLVPMRGYVAPPLDGIWATAPYLHNGSVPDIKSLLDSESRPSIWKRIGSPSPNFDYENLGLRYETLDEKVDILSYDTSIPGYGNSGHNFGDHLTAEERNAVLEYLKTI